MRNLELIQGMCTAENLVFAGTSLFCNATQQNIIRKQRMASVGTCCWNMTFEVVTTVFEFILF